MEHVTRGPNPAARYGTKIKPAYGRLLGVLLETHAFGDGETPDVRSVMRSHRIGRERAERLVASLCVVGLIYRDDARGVWSRRFIEDSDEFESLVREAERVHDAATRGQRQ